MASNTEFFLKSSKLVTEYNFLYQFLVVIMQIKFENHTKIKSACTNF